MILSCIVSDRLAEENSGNPAHNGYVIIVIKKRVEILSMLCVLSKIMFSYIDVNFTENNAPNLHCRWI